ncbi:hypothetical protein ACI797_17490 [Geodermatophilus sp. SYSU D00691]
MRRPLPVLLPAALLVLAGCSVEVRGTASGADPVGAGGPAEVLAVVPVEDGPSALAPDRGSGTHAVVTPDDAPEGSPALVDVGPLSDGGGEDVIDVVEERTVPSVGQPHAAHTADDGTVVLVGIPHPGDPLRLRVVTVDEDGGTTEPVTVDLGPDARRVYTAFSPDGATLHVLVEDRDGDVTLVAADPTTGTVTARAPVDLLTGEPVETRGLVVVPGGGLVAVFDIGGSAVAAEFDAALTRRGEPVGLTPDGEDGSARSLAVLPDGRVLVTVEVGTGDAQRLRLVAVAADVLEDVVELDAGAETGGYTGDVVVGTDGRAYLPAQVDGGLVLSVVDVAAGEALAELPLCADGEVRTLAPARVGGTVYLGGDCSGSGVVWAVG